MAGSASGSREDHPAFGRTAQSPMGRPGARQTGRVRVIYFWWMADGRILLLDIYAKGRQEDLATYEIETLKRKVIG